MNLKISIIEFDNFNSCNILRKKEWAMIELEIIEVKHHDFTK